MTAAGSARFAALAGELEALLLVHAAQEARGETEGLEDNLGAEAALLEALLAHAASSAASGREATSAQRLTLVKFAEDYSRRIEVLELQKQQNRLEIEALVTTRQTARAALVRYQPS